MTNPAHYTTLASLYATIALYALLSGHGTMAALYALIALQHWHLRHLH